MLRRIASRALVAALLGTVAALVPGSALALPEGLAPYTATIEVGGQEVSLESLDIGYQSSPGGLGGTYTLLSPYEGTTEGNEFQINQWGSTYDIDPFVTNNFNVTNLSGVPQTYLVTVTSPILPQLPQTSMSGSLGITLTNTTGTASAATSSGISFYTALIDGSPVRTLRDDPYSLNVASPFDSNSSNINFGIPVGELGPGANSTIGIQIRFTLSPGDSAGITSVFNIVPEPGTLLLMGLGLGGLVVAGRQRRQGAA